MCSLRFDWGLWGYDGAEVVFGGWFARCVLVLLWCFVYVFVCYVFRLHMGWRGFGKGVVMVVSFILIRDGFG